MPDLIPPKEAPADFSLDAQLTPAQARSLLARLDGEMTYLEAQGHLRETAGINAAPDAIRRWAAWRRRLESDEAFSKLLRAIEADNARALGLGQRIGAAYRLNELNVLMLSQTLFEARNHGDADAMEQAAAVFSKVLAAVASSRKADASLLQAETSVEKFRYDAARAALKYAIELQDIGTAPDTTEREKVERAVERLFGMAPAVGAGPQIAAA